MNIVLIGATGAIGSRILDEALRRGHTVSAVTRDPRKLEARPGMTIRAGSLLRQDGRTHFDYMAEKGVQPPTSKPAAIAFEEIKKANDLDWTAISPAASIQAGERTGKFRLGLDHLIEDDQGQSRISREDFAVAILDELEKPKHIRKRFTAAY